MRILIDITHPAYAHYFRALVPELVDRGLEIRVTSRDKDVTLRLLDAYGIEHQCLSKAGRNPVALGLEMIARVGRLRRVIRRFRPDVVLARDGLFACQSAWLTRVPSISIDDTDDARLQQLLYFPFAWRIYTDRAYRRSAGRKQRHFSGVSCLAYLAPGVFEPDPAVLERAGIAPGEPFILCRLVSWTASHDYGHRGFERETLRGLLEELSERGRVLVTSETPLDADLEPYRLGLPPEDLHHLMAFARLYVGESATMAAECAVLGVPAIHVSSRSLWYTEELARFDLVANVADAAACRSEALRELRDPGGPERARAARDAYVEACDDSLTVVLGALEEVAAISTARR